MVRIGAALFVWWALFCIGAAAHADSVTFAAFGDMPYEVPDDDARFDAVLATVNRMAPDFAVHIGDFKSGVSPCTDEAYQAAFDRLRQVQVPLIYTPGDNEWTDCHRESTGRMDPLERLEKLRALFFRSPDTSLGQAPMSLERQSGHPSFGKYVENARWQAAGIVFATLHVVGANDNLQRNAAMAAEHFDRLAANLAWMNDAFARARAENAAAVVLFMQVNPGFERPFEERSGYNELLGALNRHAVAWGKPVLLVHGDSRNFRIDKPMLNWRPAAPNLTRLETFGSPHLHVVMVNADTERPGVFSFQPVIVPGGTR
jgi:hypothetical protein